MTGIWKEIFTKVDAGVAFFTIIDYILIYVGVIFGFVAYQSWSTAMLTLLSLPILGPAVMTIAAGYVRIVSFSKDLRKS